MVAHCLAGSSGSRRLADATFMPNLMRRVRPASAAITLMHSRCVKVETSRSVCQSESTPPSSHRSTHCQNDASPEKGKSAKPSPTPTAMHTAPSAREGVEGFLDRLPLVFGRGGRDDVRRTDAGVVALGQTVDRQRVEEGKSVA